MKYAVDIKEIHEAELDPRLRTRHIGLQLFDDKGEAERYAASCEEYSDQGRTWGVVREATPKDKEFA